MNDRAGPRIIVWDTTYACPLRCVHCYSESGRRPSRQLSHDAMLRVAEAIIRIGPEWVILSGGEPFVVKGILNIARRLSDGGIKVAVYTSGWSLKPWMAEEAAAVFSLVGVSIDGATPQIHDQIRGRKGSFEHALRALAILDGIARRQRMHGERPLNFGIDCSIVQSNFHQLDAICTSVIPRFPQLQFAYFGPAVPSGLASRTGFAEHELLTEAQISRLTSAGQVARMRSLASDGIDIQITDNHNLQMHPDVTSDWSTYAAVQIEPDGNVRAMSIYEGTVGNILTDPPAVLWDRAVSRWTDPFVIDALTPVQTMKEWAEATRRIDTHFGSKDDLLRIARRPAYRSPHPSN